MKDITLLFCLALAIVLGVTSLDQTLERISDDAARRACHDLPGFYTSFETATAASQRERKPLAIVFGRSDELKTQKLKTDVLNSSVVSAIKDQFVWAYLNLDQKHNEPSASRFDIFDVPVTCVVNQQGRTIQHIQGTFVPHLFVRQLQRAIKSQMANTNSVSASSPSNGDQLRQSASVSPSK